MRSFVAIPLPEDLAEGIADLTRGLQEGRRVPAENLHVTLSFLGEVEARDLDALHEELSVIRHPAVSLAFGGWGTFGDARPRALWLDVAREPGLLTLQARVERAVRAAGLSPERRRFRPHVTLARFRGDGSGAGALGRFLSAAPPPAVPPWRATSFALMSSRLHPGGASYAAEAVYPLSL